MSKLDKLIDVNLVQAPNNSDITSTEEVSIFPKSIVSKFLQP